MIKYIGCVAESGLFDEIEKKDYIDAMEQLVVTETTYAGGQIIFCEGEPVDRICIVNRGSVRGEKTCHEHEAHKESHIVDFYEEGSMFGLESAVLGGQKSWMDFISNENSSIVFITMDSVNASDFKDKIMSATAKKLARDNMRNMEKIGILAEHGLRQRILNYLRILDRERKGASIIVKLNREQMAQYLSVNKSALSNELNKMKREGIIDFEGCNFRLL